MTPRRRRLTIALLVLGAALLWDLTRRPERQLTSRALIAGIHLYQRTLSPAMPTLGVVCRFEPSCSRYAEVSIRRLGAARGSWKALTRLARCGPWTPLGTLDPP
jgi:putative membrane protein insertion efficiency factor